MSFRFGKETKYSIRRLDNVKVSPTIFFLNPKFLDYFGQSMESQNLIPKKYKIK